jgi:hypothetical protein
MPRHKLLVIIILASLAVAALPAAAHAERTLKGPGYRTMVPSGWKIKRSHLSGWNIKSAATPGAANVLEVRVGVIGADSLRKRLKLKVLPSDPTQLVQALIPLPPGATNAQAVAQPQVTTLAGSVGGYLAIHFLLKGQGVAMNLTAIRRGNRVYLLDVLGSDNLALLGTPAIALVNQRWRWT